MTATPFLTCLSCGHDFRPPADRPLWLTCPDCEWVNDPATARQILEAVWLELGGESGGA